MTTKTALGGYKAHDQLLFVNFNQDKTCVSVGTRKGYNITNCDPFGRVYARNDGPVSIVEMLFCTSLVALVGSAATGGGAQGAMSGSGSARKLSIVNTKRQSTICELTFPTSILSVKLNRRRLVVVLEEQIYLYDISNMKPLQTIETSPNPAGICALSSAPDNSYLAYPSPSSSTGAAFPNSPNAAPVTTSAHTAGDVLLLDALSLSVTNIIQAHKAPLAVLTFNAQGTLLATSSDKGTVIRVFSTPNGDKVAQFRRGSYPARIFSISFDATSSLVCVSSDTETVHIFKLLRARQRTGIANTISQQDPSQSLSGFRAIRDGSDSLISESSQVAPQHEPDRRDRSSSVAGSIRKRSINLGRMAAGSLGGYLPGAVTEMWEPQRDFAYLKLPLAGVKSVVALSSTLPLVNVVTSEGVFYTYSIDLESGGECILSKSYSLMEGVNEASAQAAAVV
ncbi:uncharacterized protein L969DRAFT_96982 [Mixia osmundae IAM 14324]|uniref:Autophagy-related protein 18 n=1 Tax=Mixia osmundae (strain CBS 9802 / IAM 14324 / JCM 22182 / KY 12970) TaxID=764103 RepID=G7E2P3_MIXOS|nr:uncharacterized protein L969DRAFT_96982 [Mixia osmundae IAM 14324]KEI36968.1 hypothetical protein L969DRAFT_96982 [Mixia osmundae IAM 14324]GAA97103.1 hypothetical protein E5Q_03778 [Mixia osmundae IAM 14324]